MGPTILASGNVQSTFVLTVSLTPTSVTNGTTAEQSFTVAGLAVGDQISSINYLGVLSGLVDITNFRVISNNTLGIAFTNNGASPAAYPSGSFYVEVNRPYPGLAMTAIQ